MANRLPPLNHRNPEFQSNAYPPFEEAPFTQQPSAIPPISAAFRNQEPTTYGQQQQQQQYDATENHSAFGQGSVPSYGQCMGTSSGVYSSYQDVGERQREEALFTRTLVVSVFVCLFVNPLFGFCSLLSLLYGYKKTRAIHNRYVSMANGFNIAGACISALAVLVVVLVVTLSD